MQLNSVEEIIEDIRQGKMVILMDDEDRENEGDLIMAASCAQAEDINFMAKYGRGLICLPLSRERCELLRLPLMVQDAADQHTTNFTVSIEAAKGVTTGISAADRAVTVQAAVAHDAKPGDVVTPGHVFPLMAQPGGVLTRAGHTEAGCDLARLAGFEPAAVIVEILNEDGSMARRPDLEVLAKTHGLKIGTVAELIHYRMQKEKTVTRVTSAKLPTRYGDFQMHAYRNLIDGRVHFALVKGEPQPEKPVLVRVQVSDCLCDNLGSLRDDCGWPLQDILQRISDEGEGVVVLIRPEEDPEALIHRIQHYALQDAGEEQVRTEHPEDLRTYGVGAQVLIDLGVRRMRVMSAPKKMHGLSGFELEVVEYVYDEDYGTE